MYELARTHTYTDSDASRMKNFWMSLFQFQRIISQFTEIFSMIIVRSDDYLGNQLRLND